MPFSTETEALHWLCGLRSRRQRLDPLGDNHLLLEVINNAVRYVGTLQFDGVPIERVLIAHASGLLPCAVDALLDTANDE